MNPFVYATQPLNDYAQKVLGRHGPIRLASSFEAADLAREIAGAVALVVRGAAPIYAAVMDAAPGVGVIGPNGGGYDTVDIAAATARSIPVVYTPGVGARAVAEAALAFMLALCKDIAFWNGEIQCGHWKSRYTHQSRDLDGATLGIVGLGRIGGLLAEMAKPFNMRLIAHDPYVSAPAAAARGVELVGLDELMGQSDFISLHCPLTDETRGFMNRARLEQAKPGAYFINLARGGVVDGVSAYDTLYEMLVEGRLAGVGIDVFEPSPPDTSHPLFAHPRFTGSPHSLATSQAAMRRIFQSMADDMAAILNGQMPQHVVNPEVLPAALARAGATAGAAGLKG